jgi:hypothetical protein
MNIAIEVNVKSRGYGYISGIFSFNKGQGKQTATNLRFGLANQRNGKNMTRRVINKVLFSLTPPQRAGRTGLKVSRLSGER